MQAVLSSAYFPNIQYLSKFLIYNTVIIDVNENFQKQSFRNRCYIQTANGVSPLVVPVRKYFHCQIKDIEIDYSEDWQKNHFRAILSAYKNSAFFEHYFDYFKPFFEKKEKFIVDLNIKILDVTFKQLQLKNNYVLSECFIEDTTIINFREKIHPKIVKNEYDEAFVPINYMQVFSERHGFSPNLSILDLLFNNGPMSTSVIKNSIYQA